VNIPSRACALFAGLSLALALAACGSHSPKADAGSAAKSDDGKAKTSATYDPNTGQLTDLVSDRNGDGKPDTWAKMDGKRLLSIAIDRNGDGVPDRWETYATAASLGVTPPPGAPQDVIVTADEANGGDPKTVTRHEFYERGVIARVEEDTDNNGTTDKWEYYTNGVVSRVDLDLQGRGRPDRRLVYGPDGNLDHVEADPQGTGKFEPLRDAAASAPSKGRGRGNPGPGTLNR
jgi:hypothetical protein